MPNHFQMQKSRTAFVKAEVGVGRACLHVQILGFQLHETGLVEREYNFTAKAKTNKQKPASVPSTTARLKTTDKRPGLPV